MAEPAASRIEPKSVTFTINGQAVEAREGTTVLQAARSAGVDIPTMCEHEKLAGFGACRLCVVELVKGKRSRVVVSCLYPVEEGLDVQTESPKIVKHRKILLELMLARWPYVPQELLDRYQVEKGRFDDQTTFCILCGLCVRWCAEQKKENVLGFVGRGTTRQVVLHSELARKVCASCGGGEMECLQVCPTGVISNEFVGAVAGAAGKVPLVEPIRMMDADNDQSVAELVGDRRK
ncbi:MAG: (2Fe-2S)-binding protein [Deltaproteobacteria bacterium]|nr:(2Fe-2S)-binding protein [Deltaproteobacteria bacterium]